jgi:hypothetical protein
MQTNVLVGRCAETFLLTEFLLYLYYRYARTSVFDNLFRPILRNRNVGRPRRPVPAQGRHAPRRQRRLLWARTRLRRLVSLRQASHPHLALAWVVMRVCPKVVPRPVIEPPLGEPTPVLLLGHDEYGRGEIIDMTPEDEPTRATAYSRYLRE